MIEANLLWLADALPGDTAETEGDPNGREACRQPDTRRRPPARREPLAHLLRLLELHLNHLPV